MEIIIKCAGAALLCCVVCLMIKKANPELSLALSAVTAAMILLAGLKLADGIGEIAATVRTLLGTGKSQIVPMMKCVGIAAITKLSAELCKDASQSAAAASIEIAGTICAAAVSAPLIISMLKLIGDMV